MRKVATALSKKGAMALRMIPQEELNSSIAEWIERPLVLPKAEHGTERVVVEIDYERVAVALAQNGYGPSGLTQLLLHVLRLKRTEASYQRELALCLKTSRPRLEVRCPVGRIDILTQTHLIECKHYCDVNAFKHALGQVLAYSYFYKNHKRVLALIGQPATAEKSVVEDVATSLGVSIVWLDGNSLSSSQLAILT